MQAPETWRDPIDAMADINPLLGLLLAGCLERQTEGAELCSQESSLGARIDRPDDQYKTLYSFDMSTPKNLAFVGTALDDLRSFPRATMRDAGYQLDRVQRGEDPTDWKPMNTVGPGVKEIRIRDDGDQYRVIYVAKFADAVYVLHCFQKKTQKTRKADIDLAAHRYREIAGESVR